MQFIRDVLSGGVRVLIYSGNNDLVCSYSGTRHWVYGQLNESVTGKSVTEWTSWHVEGEVGGWYESWEHFAFMVVRDAGHEVPEYQPMRAYSMFQRFLSGDYSDTPFEVDHVQWMGVSGDGGGGLSDAGYLGIGIGIGIVLSVLLVLAVIGCMALRKARLERELDRDMTSHAMIQNEDRIVM